MEKIQIQDDSGDKKYFTIITNYILNHSTLWDREVYIQMKRITGEYGTCWTSRNTLAKQCGISPRRLDKSLKYLIEHNWIEVVGKKEVLTKGGIQLVNEYRICDLWNMNNEFYKGVAHKTTPTSKGIAPGAKRYSTDEGGGIAPGAHKEEPYNNIHSNKIDIAFKTFYTAYPRKVSPSSARKAFSKVDPTLLPVLLNAIEIQKRTKQWQDKQFIPHPSAWLNQKR